MSGNSNTAVPTEYAVKTFVDTSLIPVKTLVEDTNFASVYNSANATYDATGFLTGFEDNVVKYQNMVYATTLTTKRLTSFKETVKSTNKSYTYTVTYKANGTIDTITRV